PTVKQALEEFGPISTGPPVPEAGDGPETPQTAPINGEQFGFQLQNATQDLLGLLFAPGEMDAFRSALQTVLGHPFSNADIRPVARAFSDGGPWLEDLQNELTLMLPTRVRPIKIRFLGQKIQ